MVCCFTRRSHDKRPVYAVSRASVPAPGRREAKPELKRKVRVEIEWMDYGISIVGIDK